MLVHGEDGTRLHTIWAGVVSRCENSGNSVYSYYGGRGISICPDWRSDYRRFRGWALASGYREHLYLDRIDNNGDYKPENCRWVTASENCRNRRNNVIIEAFGETKTLVEWSEDHRCRVSYVNLRQRIRKYDWLPEDAILMPVTVLGANGLRVPRF